MNGLPQKILCLVAALGFYGLTGLSVLAQAPTDSTADAATNSVRAIPRTPKPTIKSPVALFRELLSMNMMEQMKYLTNRSPEDRKLILAKLREYKSMKPDQRELRLRVTELRWYLLPLLRAPAANRPARLSMMPPEHRELVEARLQEWDKLPAELQKELLENEAAISCLTELEAGGGRLPVGASQPQREKLEAVMSQWQALPEEKRQRIMARFNQFFDLDQQEKARALKTLSDAERRQIEKTLRKFGELSPVQRLACIRSFEKFASLTPEERQQFLQNAERWQLMTPDERQAWKDLVNKISGSQVSASLLFKLPHPPAPPRRPPAVAATNGN